jgi:hypothetical protein
MGSICHENNSTIVAQTVENKVVSRIYGKGRGWVFTPNHFLDLGSRSAVGNALSQLTTAGTIRRLAFGLYDYPKKHPKLGLLSPNPNAIAQAISEKDESRLQPSGAYAVNLLGLSQQVPAKIVYLTDGTEKTVVVGNQQIQLRRTTPKNMVTAGRSSGLVIQAFRYLGKDSVTDDHIATLKRTIPDTDRERLWKDRVHAPAWMHPFFHQLKSSSSPSS